MLHSTNFQHSFGVSNLGIDLNRVTLNSFDAISPDSNNSDSFTFPPVFRLRFILGLGFVADNAKKERI